MFSMLTVSENTMTWYMNHASLNVLLLKLIVCYDIFSKNCSLYLYNTFSKTCLCPVDKKHRNNPLANGSKKMTTSLSKGMSSRYIASYYEGIELPKVTSTLKKVYSA